MCELHFGSWTHEKSSLQLSMNKRLLDPTHVLGGRSIKYRISLSQQLYSIGITIISVRAHVFTSLYISHCMCLHLCIYLIAGCFHLCIYLIACVYIFVYISLHVFTSLYISHCMCLHLCIYLIACVSIFVYISLHVFASLYISHCMCLHLCIYLIAGCFHLCIYLIAGCFHLCIYLIAGVSIIVYISLPVFTALYIQYNPDNSNPR